ncbi:hypothetical protein [Sulfurisoma sediminicola]|uniref:Uncharacterized protein n=1 Tax=Sulfurisoma sediminicola TaxID=1381557 RepID=A0A497XFA1_9PROT|nr:hypothetical protein [Sulfurisoma sediminicola]RLJ64818.1 hypothetical protein DFR35_1466 [Sulfurisoma sediminicola]
MPKKLSLMQSAGIAAVLLVLFLPLPHRIAPAWSLRLVDNAGMPQAGVPTVQTWQHPLFQPDEREETLRSDAQGRVTFPERQAWGIGAVHGYRALAKAFGVGLVSGFGPVVWVHARVSAERSGANLYVSGQTPPDTIVIHRDGVCPADDLPAPATK